MDISVIVPVYNEEDMIRDCLDSILGQETDFDYEVIVVDDGSEDGTGEILYSEYVDKVKILSNEENIGKHLSVDIKGINASKTDVVVIVDGDTVITKGSLQRLYNSMRDENVGAFAGKIEVLNEGLHPELARVGKEEDSESESYGGAFFGIRKELLFDGRWVDEEAEKGGQRHPQAQKLMRKVRDLEGWDLVLDEKAVAKSRFPTGMEAIDNRLWAGATYLETAEKSGENIDWMVLGNVGWFFLLILSVIGSLVYSKLLFVFGGLLVFDLLLHSNKAKKIYQNTGKKSYLISYFGYGLLSDILRPIGMFTRADKLLKLVWRRIT